MKSLKQFNTFNLDVKCKELLFLATEDDYARFQKIRRNLPRVVATGWERNDISGL